MITLYSFYVFLFGICIGSFLNVMIYRLPNNDMSIAKGNSCCPNCNKQIRYVDLIPVLSYFLLKGRCRHCDSKISFRYPLIELLVGVTALFLFWRYDNLLYALSLFILACIFIAIVFIDFNTMTIPDELIIAISVIAVIFTFTSSLSIWSRVIGMLCVSLPMFIMTRLIKDSFGGGDVKLIGVCGFLIGWQNTLLAMFISLLSASFVSVLLLANGSKKLKSHIPFGPHIILGVVVSFFFGEQIIKWYVSLFFH